MFFITFSEMYRCLHGRSHKYSPSQRVGFDLLQCVFLWKTRHCVVIWSNCEVSFSTNGALFRSRNKFFSSSSSRQNLYATHKNLLRCSHSNPSRQVSLYLVNPTSDFAQVSMLLATTRSSSPGFPSCILPLRPGSRVVNLAEMAAKEPGIAHDVERTEKMVPFITSETAFRQNVSELASGIYIFDLFRF